MALHKNWIRTLALTLILGINGCSRNVSILDRGDYEIPKDAEVVDIETGRHGKIFVTSQSKQPQTFNPLIAEDVYSKITINQIYSPLVRLDPIKNIPIQGLAKSWQWSENKKECVFDLRMGVNWSDGHELTADDVVFTIEAALDERYPSIHKQRLTIGGEPIKVKKLGKYKVKLTTAVPYAPLLYDLIEINILPKHKLIDAYHDWTLQKQLTLETATLRPEEIVASGPFRVKKYISGEHMVLEANPHYWRVDKVGQRLPYVDYFVSLFVPDVNTEMTLFATGETDLTSSSITGSDYRWMEKAGNTYDFSLHNRGASNSIHFLWFNQNPGKTERGKPFLKEYKRKWFEDKRFRQAISYGTNREGIIKAVYFGKGKEQTSVISSANKKWFNANTKHYDYDLDNAKGLLSEAGFVLGGDKKLRDSEGNEVRFDIIVEKGKPDLEGTMTTFKENMKDLGIYVRITYLDFTTLVSKVTHSHEYEGAVMKFVADSGDPSSSKHLFRSSGRLHFWNPEQKTPATDWEARIDELMELQEKTFNEEERIAIIYELQTIFSEETPLVLLISPNVYIGVANRWHNVKIPSISIALWKIDEVWADKSRHYD